VSRSKQIIMSSDRDPLGVLDSKSWTDCRNGTLHGTQPLSMSAFYRYSTDSESVLRMNLPGVRRRHLSGPSSASGDAFQKPSKLHADLKVKKRVRPEHVILVAMALRPEVENSTMFHFVT